MVTIRLGSTFTGATCSQNSAATGVDKIPSHPLASMSTKEPISSAKDGVKRLKKRVSMRKKKSYCVPGREKMERLDRWEKKKNGSRFTRSFSLMMTRYLHHVS
jgi:hypothetical protein